MRVLIVDDNGFVRRTIRAVLADLAIEFDECADGDEVLARFESFWPQWVLMDLHMQRMDGLRATERLWRARHSALQRLFAPRPQFGRSVCPRGNTDERDICGRFRSFGR